MSKYIEQLTERDVKQFAKDAGYELVNVNIHKNCVAITLKKENGYLELSYVARDFTLRARNCFGTSELFEGEIEKAWRLFLKRKFKKEYKNDFYSWLEEQRYLIIHSNKSL